MASPDDFSIQLPQHALEEGSHNGKASHIRLLFPSLAAILLILQSILIFLLWSMLSASTSSYLLDCPDLIEKRWKRDTSYMSLDHKYDYLWNETGQSALIFDDQKSVVQITMSAQGANVSRTSLVLTTPQVSSAPLPRIITEGVARS